MFFVWGMMVSFELVARKLPFASTPASAVVVVVVVWVRMVLHFVVVTRKTLMVVSFELVVRKLPFASSPPLLWLLFG